MKLLILIAVVTSDGVRIGSGPEKSGFFIKIEVRTFKIKIRTQTGPKDALVNVQNQSISPV